MARDSLSSQLTRLGAVASLSVLVASALAAYAILQRIAPGSVSSGPVPHAIAPSAATRIQAVPPTGNAAVVATGGGSDPLTQAENQTEQAITSAQSQQTRQAADQVRAFRATMRAQKSVSSAPRPRFDASRVPRPEPAASGGSRAAPSRSGATSPRRSGGAGLPGGA